MKACFLLICSVMGMSIARAESMPLPPVVDNSNYPSTQSTTSASAKTLYELMGRLEQMQAEIQQLTGRVEEQTNLINELKKRQNTMYSDFDERMQSIESKGADSEQPNAENAQESSEPTSSAAVAAPTSAPPKPSAPVAPSAPASAPKVVAAEKPAATPPKPEPVQVDGDEKQQYQHAYDALRNGHTSQSIAEFDAFLAKFPASGLANNAQYWLGEAYRVNQDVGSARKAFSKVIDNYPGGAKVPDALLKLGYIEIEQKNPTKAREYLTRVTNEHPGTSAAHLASKKLLSIDEANR
ncbi:MAG: tol-pal system protein YbgF [Methylococcaceae bacterium]|nr:tol-pal system protein YbgF [Methylococcaceae bacterium]